MLTSLWRSSPCWSLAECLCVAEDFLGTGLLSQSFCMNELCALQCASYLPMPITLYGTSGSSGLPLLCLSLKLLDYCQLAAKNWANFICHSFHFPNPCFLIVGPCCLSCTDDITLTQAWIKLNEPEGISFPSVLLGGLSHCVCRGQLWGVASASCLPLWSKMSTCSHDSAHASAHCVCYYWRHTRAPDLAKLWCYTFCCHFDKIQYSLSSVILSTLSGSRKTWSLIRSQHCSQAMKGIPAGFQ